MNGMWMVLVLVLLHVATSHASVSNATFVSVLAYGAVADGGTTDNTQPFNNAISAAQSSGMTK